MELKFAERIKSLRKERGLNQSQLAKDLNVTQRKISYWETAQLEPDLLTLWKISNYFDVSTDFLIGKSE